MLSTFGLRDVDIGRRLTAQASSKLASAHAALKALEDERNRGSEILKR
jgi:hypothetical protein